MKKLTATIAALMLATPAMAECDAAFPFSLFEEKADGTNCEATQAEETVGELMFFAVLAAGVLEAGGVDVFPLNGNATIAPLLPQ